MPSILLVEDHLDFANVLRHLLNGRTGFEVIDVAASAEEALGKLPDEPKVYETFPGGGSAWIRSKG